MSVVADGSAVGFVAGDEYGKAHVGRVEGGSHVSAVLGDGSVGVLLRLRGMLIRCWGRLSRRLIVGLVSGCRVRVMWCCRRRVGVIGWSRLRAMRVTRMSDALAGV